MSKPFSLTLHNFPKTTAKQIILNYNKKSNIYTQQFLIVSVVLRHWK